MPTETIKEEKASLADKMAVWEHADSHRNESDDKRAEMSSVKMRLRELMLMEKKPSTNQALENLAKRISDMTCNVTGMEAKRGWTLRGREVIALIYRQIGEEEK